MDKRDSREWRKARQRVLNEEEDRCGECLRTVDKTLKSPHPSSPEVDHIIPLSRGGAPYDRSNLQLVHKWCNQKKGNRIGRRAKTPVYDEALKDWNEDNTNDDNIDWSS